MTRDERRMLLVLAVALLVAAGGYGIYRFVQYRNYQEFSLWDGVEIRTAAPGETLTMDSRVEEDEAIVLPTGERFAFSYGWTGAMEFTVERSAQRFDSYDPDVTGIPAENLFFDPRPKTSEQGFMLITLHVRNIDAVPSEGQDYELNASSFHIGEGSSLVYLSVAEGDAALDGNHVYLEPGQECTLVLGYALGQLWDPDTPQLIKIGPSGTAGKYNLAYEVESAGSAS